MKISIKRLLRLSVLTFLVFSSVKVFCEEFWDIPIKEIAKSGSNAKITTDSSGKNLYVAYSTDKLNIKKSSDYGASFSPSFELGSSANSYPQITTSSTGEYVYVIWKENQKLFSSASSDYGVSFLDPIEIYSCDERDSIQDPTIITNDKGQYVYVLWVENDYDIKMKVSTDFGTSFLDVLEIASGNYPKILTDTTGKNVIISYENDGIQVSVSSDFGKSFSKPILVDKIGYNHKLTASIDAENIFAIWLDDKNNVKFSSSSDFGMNWNEPIDFSSVGTYKIDLTTNETGQYVYAIWDDENSNLKIKISSDYGRGFSTVNLNEKGNYPKIITDSSGEYVFLVWLDLDYNVKIRVSTNFGISFDPAIELTSVPESEYTSPDITIDSAGKYIHILWNEKGGVIKTINGARLFSSEGN